MGHQCSTHCSVWFNTILAHLVNKSQHCQHFADIFIPTFQKSTCLLHIPFDKLMKLV